MTKDDFISFYKKHGRCPNQMRAPNQKLNDRQIDRLYDKYLDQEEYKINKRKSDVDKQMNKKHDSTKFTPFSSTDKEWVEARKKVYERDNNTCRLIKRLKSDERFLELAELENNVPPTLRKITPAHFQRRSRGKQYWYDTDNIYTLNLGSHSWLDSYCSPIDGKKISIEKTNEWWRYIINDDEIFDKLANNT